jgi:NTE family protein
MPGPSRCDARLWSKAWTDAIAPGFSPYHTNPLNINPLREAIDALIDFDRVRACTECRTPVGYR